MLKLVDTFLEGVDKPSGEDHSETHDTQNSTGDSDDSGLTLEYLTPEETYTDTDEKPKARHKRRDGHRPDKEYATPTYTKYLCEPGDRLVVDKVMKRVRVLPSLSDLVYVQGRVPANRGLARSEKLIYECPGNVSVRHKGDGPERIRVDPDLTQASNMGGDEKSSDLDKGEGNRPKESKRSKKAKFETATPPIRGR